MKILMLTEAMGRGGAETHVLTLASQLVRSGHTVCVASGGGVLADALGASGVSHVDLPLGSHSPFDILKCRCALRRILRHGSFDIVHSHSRLASVIVSGLAKKYGVSLVCTVHARFRITRLRRRIAKWGRYTIAVSEDLKQYLVEEYAKAPENITVIPNGVDQELFFPVDKKSDGKVRIAFLSRLDLDSALGAHLLCEIAPRLCCLRSDIEIIIGGAGSELSSIREHAHGAEREVGYAFIRCVGEVADVPQFMRSCDIFVGASRAAIEAGLCGISVVLCGNEGFFGEIRVENFEDALATNFCARGEKDSSADGLYLSIAALISEPDNERRARAAEVRELFLANCSARVCVEQTTEVYMRSLRKREQRMRGILLCGYYGFGNMGDDILLRSSIERARSKYPGMSVRALTRGGRRDSDRFYIPCARRLSPVAVLWEISRCRRIIFGGGTLLQCDTSLRSMIYYAALLILAKIMGRECILWGNGLGRADGWLSQKILRSALACCNTIEARDVCSYALAKRLACRTRVVLDRDLAERKACVYSSTRRAEYLLRRAFGENFDKFIVVIPRARHSNNDIATLSAELSRKRAEGFSVLMISMCEREDAALCNAMCSALGAATVRGICFDDLVMIARHSACVYSMRYHGLVAARLAGVPFIGIGDDDKIIRYCSENGGGIERAG